MTDLLLWTVKAVLLPLIPFWSGALVRYLCLGEFSWRVFGVAELSVSMAVLFLLLSTSAGQLSDQHLRTSLSTLCYYLAAGFFILFVFASAVETLNISHHDRVFDQVASELKAGRTIDKAFLPIVENADSTIYSAILDRIRIVALIALFLALPTAYALRYRYKLEA